MRASIERVVAPLRLDESRRWEPNMIGFFCALGVCLSLICCTAFGWAILLEVMRERREVRLRSRATTVDRPTPIPIGDGGPRPYARR
jgi:hypothetical protein